MNSFSPRLVRPLLGLGVFLALGHVGFAQTPRPVSTVYSTDGYGAGLLAEDDYSLLFLYKGSGSGDLQITSLKGNPEGTEFQPEVLIPESYDPYLRIFGAAIASHGQEVFLTYANDVGLINPVGMLSRSHDGGSNWDPAFEISPGNSFAGKAIGILPDPLGGPDTVILAGTDLFNLSIMVSNDGGSSFSSPIVTSDALTHLGRAVILTSGDKVAVFFYSVPSLKCQLSTDRGQTWLPSAITISTNAETGFSGDFSTSRLWHNQIDVSAEGDRIGVVYQSYSNPQVFAQVSQDFGATWTSPQQLSTAPIIGARCRGYWHQGRYIVSFCQTGQNSPYYDLATSYSDDFGASFSPLSLQPDASYNDNWEAPFFFEHLGILYLVKEGLVFRSLDEGATWQAYGDIYAGVRYHDGAFGWNAATNSLISIADDWPTFYLAGFRPAYLKTYGFPRVGFQFGFEFHDFGFLGPNWRAGVLISSATGTGLLPDGRSTGLDHGDSIFQSAFPLVTTALADDLSAEGVGLTAPLVMPAAAAGMTLYAVGVSFSGSQFGPLTDPTPIEVP